MKEMIYWDNKDGNYDVLYKGTYKGYNFAIISYKTHPCCYIEIPKDNILFGQDLMSIKLFDRYDIHLDVHGGITFNDNMDPTTRQKIIGVWWIGWDYCHAGDRYGDIPGDEYTTKEMFDEVSKCIDQIIVINRRYIQC